MKKLKLGIVLFLLVSCQENQTVEHLQAKKIVTDEQKETKVKPIIEPYVDSCDNGKYLSILKGDPLLDSNAFELTIYDENRQLIKRETLDVPFGLSRLRNCAENYTMVGFACGGPCYSRLFISYDSTKTKQFGYCQIVSNNENIVAYKKGEDFERTILHNVTTSEEQVIEIPNIGWTQYGHFDSLWIENRSINITYVDSTGAPSKIVRKLRFGS